jgi:tetratricopeptide (TPR) repeat protein
MRKYILYTLVLTLIFTIGCDTTAVEKTKEDYIHRGVAYYGKGQFDKAISDYNKAIEINPRDAIPYYNRGLAYGKGKGQFDKAISDYNKAIEINPKYAIAHYNIGCIYSLQNNLSKALKYLELAFQNDYDNFDWINKDSDWDNIRSSNEFKMLIEKYKK